MRAAELSLCRLNLTNRHPAWCWFFIISGLMLLLFSCNGTEPVSSITSEQSTFTADDTSDIIMLADAVHQGGIRKITITYVKRTPTLTPTENPTLNTGRNGVIILLRSHVTVTFEPEVVQTKVKRYYNLSLSNITWPESENFKMEKEKIIRNNWITATNRLSWVDRTTLILDSCTIEILLYAGDIDTIEQVLNRISADNCSYDTSITSENRLRVQEISSINCVQENDTTVISITCSDHGVFRVLYLDGSVSITSRQILLVPIRSSRKLSVL